MKKKKQKNRKIKNDFSQYNYLQRWLISCLFVCLAGCGNSPGYNHLQLTYADTAASDLKNSRAFLSIHNAMAMVRTGDLVMRTGNDFTSDMLEQLCLTDKTYSHCGIATIENDSIFVYHAMGGEWNPDEKLRRDPFELFCNPYENRGVGIFRFDLDKMGMNRLDSVVKAWYKEERRFDMKFDLSTDDRLYCAEFVTKAVEAASHHKITFSTTTINKFVYVAPDNLFLNAHCAEKKRLRF